MRGAVAFLVVFALAAMVCASGIAQEVPGTGTEQTVTEPVATPTPGAEQPAIPGTEGSGTEQESIGY